MNSTEKKRKETLLSSKQFHKRIHKRMTISLICSFSKNNKSILKPTYMLPSFNLFVQVIRVLDLKYNLLTFHLNRRKRKRDRIASYSHSNL